MFQFWSSFSCFSNYRGVLLLDNPYCMRLGGLLRAWTLRVETQQTVKKEVLLFAVAIFVTRIMYDKS